MSKGRKPKDKHTLTLHFDSKEGVENFKAWYLDAGGEQDSRYYTTSWGKDWMYVQPSDDACPECEYEDIVEDGECTNCGYQPGE